MTFAIAFSCFAIGVCVGGFLQELEQMKRKHKARVPRSGFLD